MPRLFRSHPGYVAIATFVLSVSIGVNLSVFTIVNALWIRPLPFPHPERVVTVLPDSPLRLDTLQLKIFEGGIAGQVVTSDIWEGLRPEIEISEVGRQLETLGVTSGYFKVLDLVIRGRDFTLEDDRDGAEPVGIISDDLWSRAFGRRSDLIGAVVSAKPTALRIVGVAPPGFAGARRGERQDLWIPSSVVRRLAPADWHGQPFPMNILARLGPRQSVAMAEQRYRELMEPRIRTWFLTNNPAALPTVTPLTDVFGTPESRTFIIREGRAVLLVSGLALLVLFGGCATIAALVLIHYERRRTELAVKMALGAARRSLVLELARDLSWVAATGSAGGLLLAMLGVRLMPALSLPGGVNIGRLDLSLDWRVCAVAVVAVIMTLTAAAWLPLARSTRLRLASELIGGSSGPTLGSLRVRQTLLAFQVSATIVVLVAAGLFVRTVIYGFGKATGFDINRTVFVAVQEGNAFGNRAVDRQILIAQRAAQLMPLFRQLPGVIDVAEGTFPIGPDAAASNTKPKTVRAHDQTSQVQLGVLTGSPNLLSTLGVVVLTGRHLTPADSSADLHDAAVITQSLAERLWPGGTALGQTLSIPRVGSMSVVGIAHDFAFGSLTRPTNGVVVTSGPGTSSIVSTFVIRTDLPEMVSAEVRRAIKGSVVRVSTGREIIDQDIGRQQLGAWFFSGFGIAALLLGVAGAFGLVAYLVESQRREFGLRAALGASMSHLIRRALVAALGPVSLGLALGLLVGGLVSQVFNALLVGISALDFVTYAFVAAITLGCATIAALGAAWRLRRTNPSDALRAA